MVKNFSGTCVKILKYIVVKVPDNFKVDEPINRKMADEFSEICYNRYLEESRKTLFKRFLSRI